MCGIIAYIGARDALPILLEGLKRLEYRGYDSAGVATLDAGGLNVARTVGRVHDLVPKVSDGSRFSGTLGIAHTRWATHGGVTEDNAHPQRSDQSEGGVVTIVHNGIIENHATIKKWLEGKGHEFRSETDTEVLAHLIGEFYEGDLEQAVQAALKEVTGAYAIAAISAREPDCLVVARKGSPLIVGIGSDEFVVASDSSAIVAHTRQAFTLDDYTVARITPGDIRTTTLENVVVTPQVQELEFDLGQIELGGYDHYMIKEIFEQPEALRRCTQGRLDLRDGRIVLGGISEFVRELSTASRFVFVGQGTALHACMVGKYLLEKIANIPATVEFASEFRYRNPIVEPGTVVVAISQSGETADTLAALEEAKQKGGLTLGLVNVVGSSIARKTDAGIYLRVGPEIGVASTKAFLGQVLVSVMLAGFVGRCRFFSQEQLKSLMLALDSLPEKVERILSQSEEIREATARYIDRENWLFLGRGINYPVALEGALKLKEISYIHAEGMPAAEMKHGPIALIDQGMPTVFVATRNSQYRKVLSNIEEVRSRGGHVIAVATEGDTEIESLCQEVFWVPDVNEALQPILTSVPLQLLAYHAAVMRGKDVDKPRNLAKSVTVE